MSHRKHRPVRQTFLGPPAEAPHGRIVPTMPENAVRGRINRLRAREPSSLTNRGRLTERHADA